MSVPLKKEILIDLIEDYSAAKATGRKTLINSSAILLNRAIEQIYPSQSPEKEEVKEVVK